jgi:hypothetical protein
MPPPLLKIIAASVADFMIDSMLSSIGRTKQAESCPSLVPALKSVGLLGMNFFSAIRL